MGFDTMKKRVDLPLEIKRNIFDMTDEEVLSIEKILLKSIARKNIKSGNCEMVENNAVALSENEKKKLNNLKGFLTNYAFILLRLSDKYFEIPMNSREYLSEHVLKAIDESFKEIEKKMEAI